MQSRTTDADLVAFKLEVLNILCMIIVADIN